MEKLDMVVIIGARMGEEKKLFSVCLRLDVGVDEGHVDFS